MKEGYTKMERDKKKNVINMFPMVKKWTSKKRQKTNQLFQNPSKFFSAHALKNLCVEMQAELC